MLGSRISRLEETNQELRVQLADAQRKANSLAHAHEQIHQCQSLYAQGRAYDVTELLLEMTNTVGEDMRSDKFIMDWLAGES